MAEAQQPESHLNGGGGGGGGGAVGGPISVTSSETAGSKRQRRPSVRLGEIGGEHQLYENHSRRTTGSTTPTAKQQQNQWRHHQQQLSFDNNGKKEANAAGKTSKTRALTNIATTGGGGGGGETLDEDKEVNLDTVAIGSWRVNKDSKKLRSSNLTTTAAKRVRSSWVTKTDANNSNNAQEDDDDKYSGDDDDDFVDDENDGYREFDVENSESPLKEQSPRHSLGDLGNGSERNERDVYYNRRVVRGRDGHNRNFSHDDLEFSGPSDTEAREYVNNGRCGEDGVRIWLNSLGLGRYAPVFEIHEVDDEVLPMLTLEDLKDMGISAVGSRRKMFCAIQKLGKGFS